MIGLLLQWTAAEPKNLKICVSSRELPVFLNAFTSKQRLRLQDLTRADVENFIRARVRSFWVADQVEEDAGAEETIVSKIADRASCVFLWVALVLKTLQEGCRNGDRLKDLLKKIDDIPEDIEPLYDHILRSIPRLDREAVYRTFDMVILTGQGKMGVSLLQYSFLDNFEDNPLFAIEAPTRDAGEGESEESRRLERARNRLRGQCRGLLEVESGTELITFIHRSAYDFLLRADIEALYEPDLRDFDTVEAISQTYLAELKLRGRLRHSALRDIRALVCLRRWGNPGDIPPYHFLESLRNATLQVQGTNLEAEVSRSILCDDEHWVRSPHFRTSDVISVFYAAAEVGFLDYVSWVLENHFAVSDDTMRFQRVVSIFTRKEYCHDDTDEALQMVLRFSKARAPAR